MNQTLHVNRTNFPYEPFTLGLTLKQRQKETRKLPIHHFGTLLVIPAKFRTPGHMYTVLAEFAF